MQITGGDGHGLWNDMSNNKGCTANDRYAVCGYYEEWSTDNASIRLVDEVELDLSKYREFCNANQARSLIRRPEIRLPGPGCRPRPDASA